MASLLVKHYGVKQVIVHVSTTNYIKAVRRIGVDAVVSKNISAVNDIINFIRSDQEDLPVSRIEDLNIDALELVVKSNCQYLENKIHPFLHHRFSSFQFYSLNIEKYLQRHLVEKFYFQQN